MDAKMLLLLLGFCSAVSAAAVAPSPDELNLRNAIRSPTVKTFTLQRDLYLTGDLPQIPNNKIFILKGRKNGGPKPVTINGRGTYRLFRNSPDAPVTLTLENLIITGARKARTTTDEAAAVTLGVLGTKLTIANVVFNHNDRALQLDLVTASIRNTRFLWHSNTAVYLTSQEGERDLVTFNGCTFARNRGSADIGGGAIYATMYATLVIQSSQFVNNSAGYIGGAVRLRNAYGTVRKSNFFGNWALESAGALSVYNGGLYVSQSKFKGNGARAGPGGALRVSSDGDVGSLASVSSCQFEDNKAPAFYGGAFHLDTASDIIFCGCTFKGNTGKRAIASNAYVAGPGNSITTTPKATIPAVTLEMDAQVAYKTGQKCSVKG